MLIQDISRFGIFESSGYSLGLKPVEKTIYSQAYAAFCRRLREAREWRDMTQADLAKALGRPQSFVAKVEAGERRVDVVEFLAIAKALKVSPETIIARLRAEVESGKR